LFSTVSDIDLHSQGHLTLVNHKTGNWGVGSDREICSSFRVALKARNSFPKEWGSNNLPIVRAGSLAALGQPRRLSQLIQFSFLNHSCQSLKKGVEFNLILANQTRVLRGGSLPTLVKGSTIDPKPCTRPPPSSLIVSLLTPSGTSFRATNLCFFKNTLWA